MIWNAAIRINGKIKNVEITAENKWNARKIASTLCKGIRAKGRYEKITVKRDLFCMIPFESLDG